MSQLLPPSLPRQGKKEQRGKGAREGGKENGSLSVRLRLRLRLPP